MYLTIRGLVLRVTPYSDSDAILTLLSEGHGKLTLKARGLRRRNSRLTAACQLLAYGEFVLFSYRDMNTINDAHAIELFQGLRNDLDKLALGTYFAQVVDVLSQEDTPSPQLLALILNSLYALDKLGVPSVKAKAVFELRAAALSGYMPELSGCSRCGNPFPDMFNTAEGHLECRNCRDMSSNGLRMPITSGVLDAMRFICSCQDQRIFSFNAGEDTISKLSQISEVYLSTQLERGFSALDFYKSLLL